MKNNTVFRKAAAMMLTLVMIFSVAVSSMTTARAAENTVSIDAGSIAKEIASGYAKEIIDATAGSNPVTAVLGSVGLDLFNKMINGGESQPATTDEILDQINTLKNKIDAYHKEEMGAIDLMSKKEDLIDSKIDLKPFAQKCDDIHASYRHTFDTISYYADSVTTDSMTENTKDEDVFVIDNATYKTYSTILSQLDSESTLDENSSLMHDYLTGGSTASNHNLCYERLIDAYALLSQIKVGGKKPFSDIPDFSDIGKEVDGLEADNVLYYAAYMDIIQMRYQCANHEAYCAYLATEDAKDDSVHFTPESETPYTKQIQNLCTRMQEVDEKYQDACAYFESMDNAQVTLNPASAFPQTKDFADMDLAWSTAVRIAGSSGDAQFTLLKDWTPDANGSLNPNADLCSDGFSSNGRLTANLSRGNLTICLNQHDIDFSDYLNDTVLTAEGNHTLTIYGYNGKKPDDAYLFGGAIYGGKQGIVYNATSSGAGLVLENVTLHEPYSNLIVFNGKDQSRDSVSLNGCFLNNTHHIPGQQDNSYLKFSNCTVNVNNCAVRTPTKSIDAFRFSNTTNHLNNVRYYGPNDFIII